MSEKIITRERVFFTASALAAAGLAGVAFKLIQRHREQEDDVTLEGVDQETAEQLGAQTVDASAEPIDSDVAYVGIDDDEYRAMDASEVNAIGDSKHFVRLRRRVMNGAVYLHDLVKKDGE